MFLIRRLGFHNQLEVSFSLIRKPTILEIERDSNQTNLEKERKRKQNCSNYKKSIKALYKGTNDIDPKKEIFEVGNIENLTTKCQRIMTFIQFSSLY